MTGHKVNMMESVGVEGAVDLMNHEFTKIVRWIYRPDELDEAIATSGDQEPIFLIPGSE